MTFIGVGADVQFAVDTFAYLDRTVRKLCGRYLKQHHATDNEANRHRELLRQPLLSGSRYDYHSESEGAETADANTPGTLVPVKEGLIA
jgi:hypothetical protein